MKVVTVEHVHTKERKHLEVYDDHHPKVVRLSWPLAGCVTFVRDTGMPVHRHMHGWRIAADSLPLLKKKEG